MVASRDHPSSRPLSSSAPFPATQQQTDHCQAGSHVHHVLVNQQHKQHNHRLNTHYPDLHCRSSWCICDATMMTLNGYTAQLFAYMLLAYMLEDNPAQTTQLSSAVLIRSELWQCGLLILWLSAFPTTQEMVAGGLASSDDLAMLSLCRGQ